MISTIIVMGDARFKDDLTGQNATILNDARTYEAVCDSSSAVYVDALNYDGVRYLKLSRKA